MGLNSENRWLVKGGERNKVLKKEFSGARIVQDGLAILGL